MRKPTYTRPSELPADLHSFNALNAYEFDGDQVRVACQFSDVHDQIGELAILRISMTTMAVELEALFREFSMAFHSDRGVRDILLENGGVVRQNAGAGWRTNVLRSAFLIGAFSLGGRTDFVFGDEGQIWRYKDSDGWTRDGVDASDRIFDMHGPSGDRLYAVGGNGLVLKARGRSWKPVDIGVGTDFRCVQVENDSVIIAGDQGVAGRLADGEFAFFETGINSDILSTCVFRGSRYFADSDFGVHLLAQTAFRPVANLGYTYRLDSGDHWLTAACGEYIFQFDGAAWRGIEISYRDGYRAEPYDMSFLN